MQCGRLRGQALAAYRGAQHRFDSLNPVGTGSYKLSLSLRNKTGVDVAAPWVELSLTDANGAPFARRVLSPEALNPALSQVNAESEQALSLVFGTGGQRVSGYSVNIFYP